MRKRSKYNVICELLEFFRIEKEHYLYRNFLLDYFINGKNWKKLVDKYPSLFYRNRPKKCVLKRIRKYEELLKNSSYFL